MSICRFSLVTLALLGLVACIEDLETPATRQGRSAGSAAELTLHSGGDGSCYGAPDSWWQSIGYDLASLHSCPCGFRPHSYYSGTTRIIMRPLYCVPIFDYDPVSGVTYPDWRWMQQPEEPPRGCFRWRRGMQSVDAIWGAYYSNGSTAVCDVSAEMLRSVCGIEMSQFWDLPPRLHLGFPSQGACLGNATPPADGETTPTIRPARLISWNPSTNDITVFRPTSDGSSFAFGRLPMDSQEIFFADVNGDARSDLISRDTKNGRINAFLSTGAGLGEMIPYGALPASVFKLYFADVTGDRKADLIGWNQSTNQITVWPGTGSGISASFFPFGALPAAAFEILFADVNGDGRDDLVGRNSTTGNITAFLSNGSGLKNSIPFGSLPGGAFRIFAADVNGDGKSDLVGWNLATRQITAWMSTGTGLGAAYSFTGAIQQEVSQEDFKVFFADLKGTGNAWLILWPQRSGPIRGYESTVGRGAGTNLNLGNLPRDFQVFFASPE